MSWKEVAKLGKVHAACERSVGRVELPKCLLAARRDSSGCILFAMLSSVSRARLDSISSVRSFAIARRPVSVRQSFDHHSRITSSFRCQHPANRFDQSLPFGGSDHTFLAANRRDPVILASPPIQHTF